ncbi:MAG: OmpA family protein [Planctomycetota bacterium]
MVRLSLISLTALFILAAGCESPDAHRNLEFELKRTGQERDGLRAQLQDERARSAALQKQVEAGAAELKLAQAQVARLTETNKGLQEAQTELKARLEQTGRRELKRPEVPASPLPAAVDTALQQLAERLRERIWYERSRGAISFANDRLFDSGSDQLRAEAEAGLQALATIAEAPDLSDYEIIVIGHTDASPITKPETLQKHPSNWHLSVHRAIAVKDTLVKAGVKPERIGVMGYGPERPAGSDPAQNRRVEVFIVRKGGVQPFQPVRAPRTR